MEISYLEVLEGQNRVHVLTSIATKNIAQVNININLKISKRVNANASPDVTKPLYQREPFGEQVAHAPFGFAPIEENVYRNMEMVTKMILHNFYLFTWIGDEHQVSKFKLYYLENIP
jgi:hypothetical protein